MKYFATILACLLVVVLGAAQLSAQILTGSIGGTVTDATGAVIADTRVTVTSPALIGGARTVTSDASGNYKFLELPPGTYTVRFEKTGFKAFTDQGIVLNTGVDVNTNARTLSGVTRRREVRA